MFKKFGFKIILLLFLVLAVSGCVNKTQEEAKDSETGSDQEAMTGEENDGGFLGSLKDALKLGKSMKCTWKKDEANFGTAYISDKKYKSENTVDGKLGYIVYDGECSYIWEDGKMEGLTYCLKPEDKEEVEPAEERVEEINDDQQEIMDKMKTDYDYQCSPAVVVDAVFTPPVDVKFVNPMESIPSVEGLPSLEDLIERQNP